MRFTDRSEAGGLLAERLGHLRGEDVVVRGAGHLVEEPCALDTVARLACDWFTGHLAVRARPSA